MPKEKQPVKLEVNFNDPLIYLENLITSKEESKKLDIIVMMLDYSISGLVSSLHTYGKNKDLLTIDPFQQALMIKQTFRSLYKDIPIKEVDKNFAFAFVGFYLSFLKTQLNFSNLNQSNIKKLLIDLILNEDVRAKTINNIEGENNV